MDSVKRIESRLVISLVGMAAFFVILFGIRDSASIINPILLALVITITVLPVPSRLTKRGMPGWLALVLTILMVVLVLGLVIATVFFSIAQLSTSLPTYMSSASQQAASTTDSTTAAQINQVTISMGPVMQGFLVNITNLLVQFGLALVIFFFMISAAISLPTPSRLGLDPDLPIISRITALTEDVRKYMTVLTGVNFLVGLGDTIFLMIMGVDFAVLWGMLAWFMGYIPSVGFLIALIPPGLNRIRTIRTADRADRAGRLYPDQRRGAELLPAQGHGRSPEDLARGRVRRSVRLGLPAGWHRRHPGSPDDPARAHPFGELRRAHARW